MQKTKQSVSVYVFARSEEWARTIQHSQPSRVESAESVSSEQANKWMKENYGQNVLKCIRPLWREKMYDETEATTNNGALRY